MWSGGGQGIKIHNTCLPYPSAGSLKSRRTGGKRLFAQNQAFITYCLTDELREHEWDVLSLLSEHTLQVDVRGLWSRQRSNSTALTSLPSIDD